MSKQYHSYQPQDGHGLRHDPFNAIIAPRPIGWVSSVNEKGAANLAPYSFFNAFNYTPPIIGFCSVGNKDSVNNAKVSKAFCWNLVSESLAEAMNKTSVGVSPGVDEFELAGLDKQPSTFIDVPHVAQAGVVMECKTSQILQLTSAAGELIESWMVFGEVVAVHIDRSLIEDGIYQTHLGKPVLRGGGAGDYFTVSEELKFSMPRPT